MEIAIEFTGGKRGCGYGAVGRWVWGIASLALLLPCAGAAARESRPGDLVVPFDIPRQKLEDSFQRLAIQSGRELLFIPSASTSRIAPRIKGRMSVRRALGRLLAGTRLTYVENAGGVILIIGAGSPDRAGDGAEGGSKLDARDNPPLIVTAVNLEDPVRLDGDVRRKPQAADVADIAQATLGMSAQPVGAGQQGINLRGVGAAGDATMAIYFAGVPIAGPAGTTADYGRTSSDLALIDIERVEISRGSQSTRHGVGALAGEVEIIPTAPRPGASEGFVSGGVTLMQGGQPGVQIAGASNLSAGADAAVRLTAYVRRTGGYVDNIRLNIPNVNDEMTRGVRAGFLFSPSADFSLSMLALYQYRRIVDTSAWTRTLGAYRNDRYFLAPTTHRFALGSIHLQWRPDDIGVTSITSAYRWSLDRSFDRTNTTLMQVVDPEGCRRYFSLANGMCDPDQSVMFQTYALHYVPSLLQVPIVITRVMQETRLDNGAGPGLRWLAGMFAEHRSERSDSQSLLFADSEEPPDYFGWRAIRARRSQIGLFGTLSYRDQDGTMLSLGLRYDHYAISARSDVIVPNILSGATRSWPMTRAVSDEVTAKFHIDIAVAPGVQLHGQLTRNARPGGVNMASVLPDGYLTHRPDRLWGYEIGARLSLIDEVQVTATGYLNDWTDMLYRGLSENRSHAYLVNIGDASIKGLELEVAAQILPGLTGRIEGSLIDARLTGTAVSRDLIGGAVAGDHVPFVPRRRWKAGLSYRWAPRPGWQVRLGGDWQYQSGYWATFNRADPDFVATDAYSLMGLSASLDAGRWNVTLTGRNLLNSEAPIRAWNGFVPGETYSYGPRALTLAWTMHW